MTSHTSASWSDVLRAHKEIITELRAKSPQSKLIVVGHTPYGDHASNEKSKQINAELKRVADDKTVFYIDISSHLTDASGKQLDSMFRTDHVHLSTAGYKVWSDLMGPLFDRLMQ